MKRALLLLAIVSGYCYGQREFPIYSNGLIYDSPTMKKLGHIVDSLNLKFKTCDLAHPYYSFPQGMATLVSIPSDEALKLIESNITLDSYLKSYPNSIVNKDLWIVQSRYTNYKEVKIIEYAGLPGHHQEPRIRVNDTQANDKMTGWIVDDEDKQALYLSKLEARPLPFEYARLVQYVDCMIDTTAEIYFPKAKKNMAYQQADENSKANRFIAWAENFPNKPEMPDFSKPKNRRAYERYFVKEHQWDTACA